jgi:demethylmenaquinone methyltransferase/2-methoxy-6-polyprenyl-1,4-benzoquinol methylase
MVVSLPAPAEKREFVARMFDAIAPRYDLVNRLMTFGMDRSWRRKALASLAIKAPAVVVDLGCGTGDLCTGARALGAEPIGVDLSAGMLAEARARGNVGALLRSDAARLPLAAASCDAAISGFALRNFESVESVLGECGRVLREGGRLAILEIDRPDPGPFSLAFGVYFKRIVPLLGSAVSSGYAYRYLADSTVYLPPWLELQAMLGRSGFEEARKTSLAGGSIQLVTAVRRASGAR